MSRTATWGHYIPSATGGAPTNATLAVSSECLWASVTEAADTTTVGTTPCILYGLWVTAAFSANITAIKDGTATVLSIPASAPVGTFYSFPFGIRFETSLIVDPVDAGTGGVVTVFYRPL